MHDANARKSFCEDFAPAKTPPVAQWAEEHVRFDLATDAVPRYVLAKSPYAQFVFDSWLDPEVEEVFVLWPTQAGKTAMMVVLLAYIIANDPGPVMFVQSDEKPVKAFVRFRLKPTLDATFPDSVRDRGGDWTDDYGAFVKGTHIWPAWSTSEPRCRSWPRRYILGDETSLWKLSRRFMLERTKQFPRNKKALWGTTPTFEDEQSWIDATNVFRLHRWWVPCPHCGAFQTLEFSSLKFDHCRAGDGWDLDKVERETFYECQHCGKAVTEKQRARMIAQGEARTEVPERSKKQVSLRVTALDVPGIPWGTTARTFLESKNNPRNLVAFVNGWLVEPWREPVQSTTARAVAKRTMGMTAGHAPKNTAYLLAGVDVQRGDGGHTWVTVNAFMEDRRAMLVLFHRVNGDGSIRRALARTWEEVLSREFPVAGVETRLRVAGAFVDSGDGEVTDDVYAWCFEHAGIVWAVKGSSIHTTARMTAPHKTVILPNGLELLHVNKPFWMWQVHMRYARPVDEPGAWLVPDDVPQEYAEHIASWGSYTRKLKAGGGGDGGEVRMWKRLKRADHGLFCQMYCLAGADARFSEQKIVDIAQLRQQQSEREAARPGPRGRHQFKVPARIHRETF